MFIQLQEDCFQHSWPGGATRSRNQGEGARLPTELPPAGEHV